MKKFFGVAAMLMATVAFFSCDPAESEFKYDYYFDNIYTVNKNKLYPEFSDSSIIVPNVDKFGLETGHRAHLVLRNYYDYSTMKAPKWEIATLVDVIPTLPLQVLDSADAAGYNTVFTTLNSYELMDRFVQPVWVWNKLQNINVSFIGLKDNAEFAMSVRGVRDGCVELDLRAKAKRSGSVTSSKLLTFDLSNVADFLKEEDKKSLAGVDSLKTRIYLMREEEGVVKEVNFLGGKFPNPIK